MAKFVPVALRESAWRLQALAERVAFLYASVGALLGFVGALVAMAAFVWLDNVDPAWWKPNRVELILVGLVGAALGGLLGWQLGAVQAERLRVEATTALYRAQNVKNPGASGAVGDGF